MLYNILKHAHSGWAYVAILLLLFATVNAIIGFFAKREFTPSDRKLSLFALASAHLQIVIGIAVYFVSPYGLAAASQMSDKALRLTAVEHPLVNILAIALITVGWVQQKKLPLSKSKFKSIAILYGLGLLLILSRLPWKLWL